VLVKKSGLPAEQHNRNPFIDNGSFPNLIRAVEKQNTAWVNQDIKNKTRKGVPTLLEMFAKNNARPDRNNLELIQKITSVYSNAIDYHISFIEFKKTNELSNKSLSNILELLVSLLELKDPYTCGHSNNVKKICINIAQKLGINNGLLENLSSAAMLHDIGKIGIPENILNKPSALSRDEFEQVKKHPLKGALLVANIPKLKQVGKYILHHHEGFDGRGYPMGLYGSQIPLPSCIIAVADAYDAITSKRPYRDKMSSSKALEIISRESGQQFDPMVVDAFWGLLPKGKKYLLGANF